MLLPQSYEDLYQRFGWLIQARLNALNRRGHSADDLCPYIWIHLLQSQFLEHAIRRYGVDAKLQKFEGYLYVAIKNHYLNYCRTYDRHQSRETSVAPEIMLATCETAVSVYSGNPETVLALNEACEVVAEGIYAHAGAGATQSGQRVFEELGLGTPVGTALHRAGIPAKARKQITKFVREQRRVEIEFTLSLDPALLAKVDRESRRLQLAAIRNAVRTETLDQIKHEVDLHGHVLVDVAPVPEPTLKPKIEVLLSPDQKPLNTKHSMPTTRSKRSKLTVPERVAAAMRDGVWDAGALAKVLVNAFQSNNRRTYISSILSSARVHVPGPNGKALLRTDGRPLEVPRFTVLERGRYRVATREDIQHAVHKLLGNNVTIGEVPDMTIPADEFFAEHGFDVRPVMEATGAPKRVSASAAPTAKLPINVTLSMDEATLIVDALGQLPYARVHAIIERIQQHARVART